MHLNAVQLTTRDGHRVGSAPTSSSAMLVAPLGAAAPIIFDRMYGDGRSSQGGEPREGAYVVHVLLRDAADARLRINGQEVCPAFAAKGAVFLFSPGASPITSIRGSSDMVRFCMSEAGLNHGLEHRPVSLKRSDFGAIDVVLFHLASSLLPMLEANPITDDAAGDQMVLDHIAEAIQAHMLRTYAAPVRESNVQQGGLAPWQLRRAKAYIEANLSQTPSLGDLARECQISASHFARAFRASVGRPPHRYLLERRVEAAKACLADVTLSLRDIAIDCGFSDQSHLSRVFSKHVGETPGAWRRRQRP